jgi:hypothetical protein
VNGCTDFHVELSGVNDCSSNASSQRHKTNHIYGRMRKGRSNQTEHIEDIAHKQRQEKHQRCVDALHQIHSSKAACLIVQKREEYTGRTSRARR